MHSYGERGEGGKSTLSIEFFIACSLALYFIGLYCLVTKKNLIKLIIGIEIIVNAADLNFIAFAAYRVQGFTDPLAQSFVIISIGVSSCVIAVGLAIAIYAYRRYKTLDVSELKELKW